MTRYFNLEWAKCPKCKQLRKVYTFDKEHIKFENCKHSFLIRQFGVLELEDPLFDAIFGDYLKVPELSK